MRVRSSGTLPGSLARMKGEGTRPWHSHICFSLDAICTPIVDLVLACRHTPILATLSNALDQGAFRLLIGLKYQRCFACHVETTLVFGYQNEKICD